LLPGNGDLRTIRRIRIRSRCALLLFLAFIVLCINGLQVIKFASAQVTLPSITSYRVDGAPNYDAPGSESFWNNVGATTVPLAASVSPGGGHTANVLVKSANDGYNIYVLLQWHDDQGPSFGTSSEIYQAPNGTLLTLDPASTSNVGQLFYNSTYYYPDRAAVLWFLPNASNRQQSPVMQLGSNGAITGGAANIWHWQSTPTDNNPNDTAFPGGYTDPSGNPILPSDNLSFAEDDYTNTTGFFVIAGNFGQGSPNLAPYADPYLIHAGNSFSTATKTWTIEMVRAFNPSDAVGYRVLLANGANYFVAFAIWNGRLGESAHVKSVSQWYNLTISNQTPPALTTAQTMPTASGVSATLSAVVAIGLLIVGVVIGILTRPKPQSSRR
jgi:hypothetical protein